MRSELPSPLKITRLNLDLWGMPPFIVKFILIKSPIMSQHNSFKASGGGGKKNRTVLKRFERVDLLRKRGQWVDGNRVIGLKKTKPEE